MLVLSRKKNQRILFPNLGVEVSVQRIAGNTVSVGITAPKSVQILRGELADEALKHQAGSLPIFVNRDLLHTLRNQLNKAQLTVALAQKQLEMGQADDADKTLADMLARLVDIDQQLDSTATHSTSTADHEMAPKTASSGGKRALIVEDDANERALLAGYLRLCGFKTSEAGDGVEAVEFLRHQQVDLVVLDMRMPRMNGQETVKAIRSRPQLRDVKIVVVSGEDREEAVFSEVREGVVEWFDKPLNPDRLARYFEATNN